MVPSALQRLHRSSRVAARSSNRQGHKPGAEILERRELLAWSGLVRSLPDLTIQGYAAPIAAYGQPLAVTVEIQNQGANSIPMGNQAQYAPSPADAGPSTVSVFYGRNSRFPGGALKIAEFPVEGVPENCTVEVTQTIQMPSRLRRWFPKVGSTGYLFFRVDINNTSGLNEDFDPTNNVDRHGVPIQIAPALPDLYGYALDVPPLIQPGDAILPTIQIVNYGSVNTNTQGSFEVLLVASTDQYFGPGDPELARFTVNSIEPLSLVPIHQPVLLGDVNIDTPNNVVTLTPPEPISLDGIPRSYFIGVVVDPDNNIQELNEVGSQPESILNPIKLVQDIHGLPPAAVVQGQAPVQNVFPIPPYGPLSTNLPILAPRPPLGPISPSPAPAEPIPASLDAAATLAESLRPTTPLARWKARKLLFS